MKSKSLLSNLTVTGLASSATLLIMSTSCTKALEDTFRFAQRNEQFGALVEVNTKVDILWVVDNSASMDVSQDKLRQGFAAFANKYMKPTWDMQSAVITTDTYIANSAFSDFRTSVIPGTVNYASPYINAKVQPLPPGEPLFNPNLVTYNGTNWVFGSGVKQDERIPAWQSNYSKLLAGKHDGPITGLCFEGLPHFLDGSTNCKIRDDGTNTGTDNCLNPQGGESALTQCVNTVFNDTVRSGNAVIKTRPPSGTPGDQAWVNGLIENFRINLTTGTAGHGSERGLESVLQLLADNETSGSSSALFRAGSLRVIVFVADEDDQSLTIPGPAPANYSPWDDYRGAVNGEAAGTGCSAKTVGGHTYTLSSCPDSTKLKSVSSIKTQLDNFFLALDGNTSTDAGYFIVSIIANSASTIQTLQAERDAVDTSIGFTLSVSVDRGDRYSALGTQVGNDSFDMDIGSADYSPILEQLGQTIISKKGSFQLSRLPTGEEDMIVSVIHSNGSIDTIDPAIYEIQGQTLVITDLDFILSLGSTDTIVVNYQPKKSS